MKKISVIIPAYNMAELTVKAVESVLNQTYENIEIIVVDDGSTDNTRQRLISYAKDIKYVYKKNGGACSARNLGISLSTGEYIGFLDCDDTYLPKKVELCVDYLEKHPDFGFVHTAAYYVDRNDTILRTFSHRRSRRIGWIAKKLLPRNYICNSTPLVRRVCFEKTGLFDETIFIPADWDMWLRLAEKYQVGYMNTPLTLYRMSGSYILNNVEKSKQEEKLMLEKAFLRNPQIRSGFKKRLISDVYLRCAIYYLLIGRFQKAKQELGQAIAKSKTNFKAILLLGYFFISRKSLQFLIKKKVYYNFGF